MKEKQYRYTNFIFPYNLIKTILLFQCFQIINSIFYGLNYIKRLGNENCKFIEFSSKLNGDMIISAYNIVNNERVFFGLKKNGRPLFTNNDKETQFASIVSNIPQNFPSTCFIQLSNSEDSKEYLLSISTGSYYAELYDLEKLDSTFVTSLSFLGKTIVSERIALLKSSLKTDSNNYYYIGFVEEDNEDFYLMKLYLESSNIENEIEKNSLITFLHTTNKNMISCFETTLYRIICLYQSDEGMMISIYDSSNGQLYSDNIYSGTIENNERIFLKGVLLKEEIGVFMFYTSADSATPYVLLKQYNTETNKMDNFNSFEQIVLAEVALNSDTSLNDIMKVNDHKLCVVSASPGKHVLYILIFNLYDEDSKLLINYYYINILEQNEILLLSDLRVFLFKDFISLGFSNCYDTYQCDSYSETFYSSLTILHYPNSTDSDLDLIDFLFMFGYDISELSIDLSSGLIIENNIFGYTIIGTKIIDISEGLHLYYINNDTAVLKDYIIPLEDNCKISLSNPEICGKTYRIEYAGIVKEPKYSIYINFIDSNQYVNEGDMGSFYTQSEYIGRSLFYNIIMNEGYTNEECKVNNCAICSSSLSDECIICNYRYFYDVNEKKCIRVSEEEDNIQSTIISTELSTVPNQKSTIQNEKSTILNEKSTIPNEKTTILNEKSTIPFEKSTFPNIKSTVPIQKSTIPNIKSTIPHEKSTFLNEKSTIPLEKSTVIHEKTTVPSQISTIINQINPSEITTESLQDSTNDLFIGSTAITKSEEELNSLITNMPLEDNCSKDNIIKNKCEEKINSEQINAIYTYLQDEIHEGEFNKTNNTIIWTKNINFQVTTEKEQKNNKYYNLSSIELDECSKKIKGIYNIKEEDNLIILKTDIRNEHSSAIYVQYEIYNPYTLDYIPLDICQGIKVNINVPVSISQETELLYYSLNESGYNLFNSSDSFYHDVCSIYTTQNGTDISLLDRKELIYDNNKDTYLCQDGCQFISYNSTTKQSKCNCDVQNHQTIIYVDEINFNKTDIDEIIITSLKNSNFKVIKCYKLIFSKSGQTNNIGSYILLVILLLLIISMIFYCIYGNKKLNYFVELIIKQNFLNTFNKRNGNIGKASKKKSNNSIKIQTKKRSHKSLSIGKNLKRNKNLKNSLSIINENTKKTKTKIIDKNNDKANHIIYKNIKKKNNFPPKKFGRSKLRRKDLSTISKSNYNLIDDPNKFESKNSLTRKGVPKINNSILSKISKKKSGNNKIINIINYTNKINIYHKLKKNLYNKNKSKDLKIQKEINALKDQEINDLPYIKALQLDKRTYFQYYFSLLKIKHLILYTFLPSKDYNLIVLKISLFLLSFSLYFTINAFFFSDKSMHIITICNGIYNIIYQTPQILISSLISIPINKILRVLSLSQSSILSIKKETNLKDAKEKSKRVLKELKIKFIFFFIISFIFIFFFWYFISGFCAVYKNTQIALIENTAFSFTLSMIYPFAYNFVPGIFRISSLRNIKKNKKNKECLYKLSKLLSMI